MLLIAVFVLGRGVCVCRAPASTRPLSNVLIGLNRRTPAPRRKLLADEAEGPSLLHLPSMSGRGADAFARSAEADEVRAAVTGWLTRQLQRDARPTVGSCCLCWGPRSRASMHVAPETPLGPTLAQVLGAGAEAAVVALLEPALLPFQR